MYTLDKNKIRQRLYYLNNKTKFKLYYQNNKQRIKEYNIKNRQKIREYRKTYKEKKQNNEIPIIRTISQEKTFKNIRVTF